MQVEKVLVVGLGYIGLPTAAVIANRGIDVVGLEVNEQAIETINAGEIHIVEPDLDIAVRSAVTMKKLRATKTAESADVFIIAVPTPFKEESHKPDLSYIKSAARSIAPYLEQGNLVILESTSPVGATEKLSNWLSTERPDLTFPQQEGEKADVQLAHCPERVLPGYVLQELVNNDRIIGGMTLTASKMATAFYKNFVRGECVMTNARTAEMAKLTENSFRDVNIAFANELSIICDKLQINVWELVKLANRHPRVNILNPGPGVGGHCIAVDPWFIIASCPEEAKLIKQARVTNGLKPRWVVQQVVKAAAELKHPKIACLGLAFKADIDDVRQSPAIDIIRELAATGQQELILVEPNISKVPELLKNITAKLLNLSDALDQANIILLLVDHKEFNSIDRQILSKKIVIDTKGILA